MNEKVSSSAAPIAHPPRSNPLLRSSSVAPPFPCITPSTVTCVMVVSFMIAIPFSSGTPLAGGHSPYYEHVCPDPTGIAPALVNTRYRPALAATSRGRRRTYKSMGRGPVDELLNVTVERPVLDQLQVEVGRTLEDWVHPGLTGDDREQRHGRSGGSQDSGTTHASASSSSEPRSLRLIAHLG